MNTFNIVLASVLLLATIVLAMHLMSKIEQKFRDFFRRNSMIEQLHEQGICDRDGNLYGMSAPNNFELMKKINELVEEVNRLKEKFEEE